MGKGDRRSRRGKIWAGTHGKRRPRKGRPPQAKEGEKPQAEAKAKA